ncbi:MAG: glycosyltransferase family 4 protein [Patescibacteria group bacterium]
MKILQLTSHYYPNLGGVETHLQDLVKELTKKKHQVFVLTYRPLSTNSSWSIWENSSFLKVFRIPWFPGLFNKLSTYSALEFLYLVPGLFIILPFILIFFKPRVIHSHGLVAGFVGAFWGKLFGIHTVISTHSIYHFPKSGLYRAVSKHIFLMTNQTLCLSNQSVSEIVSLGIPANHVHRFTYWVDLDKFKPMSKSIAKKKLKWKSKFCVLFVGRLVKEKGIMILDEAASALKKHDILVYVAGSGPEFRNIKNCILLGSVSQEKLPIYYNAADLLIVPSIHEEGFGRVILESLACGTPVVAANRGAIPEAMDNTVGKLIDITPKNIAKTINDLYQHTQLLAKLAKKSHSFATRFYSPANIIEITSSYE